MGVGCRSTYYVRRSTLSIYTEMAKEKDSQDSDLENRFGELLAFMRLLLWLMSTVFFGIMLTRLALGSIGVGNFGWVGAVFFVVAMIELFVSWILPNGMRETTLAYVSLILLIPISLYLLDKGYGVYGLCATIAGLIAGFMVVYSNRQIFDEDV